MKILFISHTYPPVVGGVETQNYELSTWLAKQTDVKLIANKKRWLILFFLVYASIRAVLLAKKYDVLILGSCLLGNIGWFVKKLTRKPVIAVAHGLDLTWKNKLYQKLWIGKFVPSLDKLIAVGNETIAAGINRNIPRDKFVFVPNGVDTKKFTEWHSRQELEKIVGQSIERKKVLLTSGRLAKRKGVAWFVENVMPQLSEEFLYVIAGNGPDKNNIAEAIKNNHLEKRVIMLGYVPDSVRNILMSTADLFLQPNIKIPGDMEGFGISVIEAGACRLPVLASNIEGLKDAIKEGQNGFLIEPKNADAFLKKINELMSRDDFRLEFGEKARKFVVENFSWEKISQQYLKEIKTVISKFKS
jgi:glycosyltransferase involved in cell wall biosynthesis